MRLFVALALPSRVKDELARIASELQGSIPGARWVPREDYHLTLSFLGKVDDRRVPEISAALAQAVAAVPTGRARLDRLGAFPTPRRARVLWASLADPAGIVEAMAGAVIDAMAGAGFPPERRSFRGHVTLARLKDPASVSFPAELRMEPLTIPVDRATLFNSRLGRPAARYEVLAAFPLGST